MNIYHLKYFQDAARLGSVSAAADLNLVTHSAVSQAIRSLESLWGVPLMIHARRKFQLTPQGELCLREIPHILNSVTELQNRVKSQTRPTGNLQMMAPQSMIHESLIQTACAFRKEFPGISLKMATGSAKQVRAALLEGRIQIGFAIDDGLFGKFPSETLKQGHFLLVGPGKNVDLKKTSLIVTSTDKVEVRQLFSAYAEHFKKEPEVAMEIESWSVIKALAMRGAGIGYVPDYCVTQEMKSHRLKEMKFPGARFRYEMKAVWSPDKPLHSFAKSFLERSRTKA